MTNKKQKPAWWTLFLILPLMIGFLLLETRLPLTSVGHTIAEVGIVLLGYGVMAVWVHVNQSAIMQDELDKYPNDLVVHVYPPTLRPENEEQQPDSSEFALKDDYSRSSGAGRRDPLDFNYPMSRN